MAKPNIKIIAISNVYCRLMHFEKQGDQEIGHYHTYDHGTLVSSGSVLVEMMDGDTVESSKVFQSPSFIFIAKDKKHRITAQEDNTVCACIHAMRDIKGSILSPEFLLDERSFVDKAGDSDNINDHYHLYTAFKRGVETDRFSLDEPRK